jgi:phospholipid/cholesterol/gamma-HCH transport system substrate-binding protein
MKLSKEFKIGLFVVVVITASFFLINYLRGTDVFDRQIEISAVYPELDGLVPSAPVYIKGYKAGSVSSVKYEPASGNFTVTCSVLKEFMIPIDSKMMIYGVDIMGGKGIRIDLGSSSQPVEDGGVLAAASEPALIDGVMAQVTPIIEKVGTTLDSLNATVATVNCILSDVDLSKTMAHLERTMADVSAIAAQIEGKSEEFDTFVENLTALSSKFVSVTDKADTLVTDVTSVVSSFHGLVENINDPDGTIGRLLTDDSVYESVDSLLSDIDVLVKKIQENPKKYIRISVF